MLFLFSFAFGELPAVGSFAPPPATQGHNGATKKGQVRTFSGLPPHLPPDNSVNK
jgi:hypothetical protein